MAASPRRQVSESSQRDQLQRERTADDRLFVKSEFLVSIFTSDPLTIYYATNFAKTFSVAIIFISLYFSLAGALHGAGDAMTPFIARTTGFFGVFLGLSYLLSVPLNFGVFGIYVGISVQPSKSAQ